MASQRFYNLTYEQVKIDSVLPNFACSLPLYDNYDDSVYTVSILYPEFVDMTENDVVQYNRLSGAALSEMPVVMQNISVERKKASLEVQFMPLTFRDKKYKILVSFMLKVEAKAKKSSKEKSLQFTRSVSQSSSRYVTSSVLSTGNWAKIRVPASGVYQITDALIKKAGFTDLGKVKVYGYGGALQNEVLLDSELVQHDDVKEVPICVVNGKYLFHAQGPVSWSSNTASQRIRNPYSDYGYYFITQNDENPITVDSLTFLNSFYPSADDYHSLYEVDGYAWYQGGRNLYDTEAISVGGSKNVVLKNTGGATGGSLYVKVSAGTASKVDISLNGKELGSLSMALGTYDKACEAQGTYTVSNVSSVDTITITTVSGGPVRLDYVSMAWNKPDAVPDLNTGNFDVPEYVYNITNQNHHSDEEAQMVIIIPTSQKLNEQAQRLKAFHESHDSISVNIVPADELYNEFSSGTPDANAYRRYMKMLYDRADTEDDMPKYLLLMGDCMWDNRMLTSDTKSLDADDYLLCYESENSYNEISCYVDDGFFCLLDDGEGENPLSKDKPDMAVGRFPVTTAAQAKIMVDKTIGYVNNENAGAWQNTLMFMGDDGNNNLHMDDADKAADDINSRYPGFLIKKVMWDAYYRVSSSTGYTYPEVATVIKQQQAAGALIMDYAGHGAANQISHEAVLMLNDFAAFSNKNLPLWITASCDIMPFDGSQETIGETAVLNSNGGAVAFYGTARTVYQIYNKPMNMTFLKYVLGKTDGKPNTIGEAQRLAKIELISQGKDLTCNKLQYSLLGDPAIALKQPDLNIVIDSVNGTGISSDSGIQLKAGSTVRLSGHVENTVDFNGIVTTTVRDSKEEITCKMNDTSETDTAFVYTDRTKTLFSGTDSVVSGKFSFSFAIPKDINYSNGTGLINLYAVNGAKTITANGYNGDFTVGGSAIESTDSIGPSLYCYLNSPSFVNGGDVNTTPYFVAEISDKDGINTTGNGIGHDMELIIDGDMSKTYILNSNFAYDFGIYTSGSTYYDIPELNEGEHSLIFRAWDIMNNSSTVKLSFNVVKGLSPELFNISVSKNPASTSTTFIINHDRTGSDLNVEIEVFDTTGRLLWKHNESGVPTTGTYTVDWDLTTEAGNRLHTGVYVYRVKVSSDGSETISKAKKLIVVGNN